MNKCENWDFGNWELDLEVRILKDYLKIEFKKINK